MQAGGKCRRAASVIIRTEVLQPCGGGEEIRESEGERRRTGDEQLLILDVSVCVSF